MRRYQKEANFRRHILSRSKSQEKKRRKFNSYVKRRNTENDIEKRLNKDIKKLSKITSKNKFKKFYTEVEAPKIFSFIDNPEEIIGFISEIKTLFDKKKSVFVRLHGIEVINYDAIVLLLSIMIRFKAKKIPFNGDFPKNRSVRLRLEKSGFFTSLYDEKFRDVDKYKIVENTICTHAKKLVDANLGSKLIDQASQTIWGIKRRCPGLQRVLLESMLNTNNHAEIGKEGEKHWWLSMNSDSRNKKTYFSFIDYGVGVLTSLENKPEGNKFFGWFEKLFKKSPFNNNAELLKLILDGELHATVTGKAYRGKGLPGIKEALARNQISRLFIITNDVYANVGESDFRVLKNNFSGTFLYWELNDKCQNF